MEIPLGTLTCVTGVSGSGKSSLVTEVLNKHLLAKLNHARTRPGACRCVTGMEHLDKVIDIDQSPIGRTPRSNPATYTGLFNDIRDLYASTNDAKIRGYGPGRFSFNVKGGRCEACCGDGLVKIEMHFLADVYVPCEVCKGARYNRETLEVLYKGKNISQVLDMTAEEAVDFFESLGRIVATREMLLPSINSNSSLSSSMDSTRIGAGSSCVQANRIDKAHRAVTNLFMGQTSHPTPK